MAAPIRKRARAKRDLAEHASIETAERFLLNADKSFSDLSRQPEMGPAGPAPAETGRPPQMGGERV
jgi:hypothetical protein